MNSKYVVEYSKKGIYGYARSVLIRQLANWRPSLTSELLPPSKDLFHVSFFLYILIALKMDHWRLYHPMGTAIDMWEQQWVMGTFDDHWQTMPLGWPSGAVGEDVTSTAAAEGRGVFHDGCGGGVEVVQSWPEWLLDSLQGNPSQRKVAENKHSSTKAISYTSYTLKTMRSSWENMVTW